MLVGPATAAPAPPSEGTVAWGIGPASADGLDGRPRFEYVVEVGDRYDDAVAITNFGTAPLEVDLYASDALPTEDGGFAVAAGDDPTVGLGAWVLLKQRTVVVPSREVVVIPFSLSVPADAEPGDHAGGILASVTTIVSADGGSVERENRLGTRMHVRVAGPIEPAVGVELGPADHDQPINPVRAGAMTVAHTVVNDGNIRLDVDRTVEVSSLFGWWSTQVDAGPVSDLLPGSAVSTVTELDGVPPLGPLTVTVRAAPGGSAGQALPDLTEASSRVTVWAVPWPQLVALAILVLFVWQMVGAALRVRRLKAQLRAAHGSATVARATS